MHPLASPLLYVCSLLLLLLLLYTKKVLLSSSETTTNNNSGWSTTVSSVARRPPLDFGGWSQSVFFQNVLLLPFAIMTARRATILRREEAEREVASREEKRREDGFPVNRPGRLARAQTRATLRRVLLRRRRHGGLFFTKTTKMCAYVQSALINNGKMCGEKLSRIGSEKVFTFCGYILIF